MPEENQTEFRGWAKVEVMGHQSHIGFVTTEAYGAAVLFRIDQPEIPEREQTLQASQYIPEFMATFPAGSVVKYAAIPAVSVLVGAGSIYRIIPCTEEAARKAIVSGQRRPLQVLKLGEERAIEAPVEEEDEEDVEEAELFSE